MKIKKFPVLKSTIDGWNVNFDIYIYIYIFLMTFILEMVNDYKTLVTEILNVLKEKR